MKISTVIGGGIVFVAGIGTGVYLACKSVVKLDEKIYKGKLREKFADATVEATTSFLHKKFDPKRFEPRKFEYARFNREHSFHAPNEIIFESRVKANEIMLMLNDLIAEYGCATIADFYDLVDAETNYIDTKYGWHEGFSDELIIRAKGGWIIDFPDTCEL